MDRNIPLSYNTIKSKDFIQTLNLFNECSHKEIITRFEHQLQLHLGSSHIVALNSGTSAIHLALKVLGIGAGDLVLAPTFTFVATLNPILYLGAIPVLVDVEPFSWNLDPALVKLAIADLGRSRKKIKAMIIVHNYGVPAKMDELLEIAKAENILVIEDAAEAMGAIYQNKQVGTLGDIGVLSFNNNKTFTTFGGGAIMTEKGLLANRVLFYASQARTPDPNFEYTEVGYNYLISPLNAAYGLAQLPLFKEHLLKRKTIFNQYKSSLPNLSWNSEFQDTIASRWLTTTLFESENKRNEVRNALEERKIETRLLWKPLHTQPLFCNFPNYVNKVSENLFKKGLCLPSSNDQEPEATEIITDVIKNWIFDYF